MAAVAAAPAAARRLRAGGGAQAAEALGVLAHELVDQLLQRRELCGAGMRLNSMTKYM